MSYGHRIGERPAFEARPELRGLNWWMYAQRNRINARWSNWVRRAERRKEELYRADEKPAPPAVPPTKNDVP